MPVTKCMILSTGDAVMYKTTDGAVTQFNLDDNSTTEVMDNSTFVSNI